MNANALGFTETELRLFRRLKQRALTLGFGNMTTIFKVHRGQITMYELPSIVERVTLEDMKEE